MNLFYSSNISSKTHYLDEEESKHCSRVLRLKPGDRINLVNGTGDYFTARIIEVQAKRTTVEIIHKKTEYKKRNFYLHIAMAPTKSIDRFEWFLEKVTEIGVDEITPLLCEHSERKGIKLERLEKILISAMKQSDQSYLPKLNGLMPCIDFIHANKREANYVAYCQDIPRVSLINDYKKGRSVIILIGPEGDFSSAEIEYALNHGYKGIDLGPNRLRTETAGVVACCSVNLVNQYTG